MHHPPSTGMIAWLVILGVGALFSALIAVSIDEKPQKSSQPELSLAYYLDDAELIGTNEDGTILYQVWTDKAAQNTQDQSIALDQVRMKYVPQDGLPWTLRANAGSIPADASFIRLNGDVVATTGDSENQTTVRTFYLDIDPETREAFTQDEVVIEYNGREVNATGMRANFATNQLNLLSNVNGKFAP